MRAAALAPREHEDAARLEHAGDLRDRWPAAEPVERLGDVERLRRSVRERALLRVPGDRLRVRDHTLEHRTHLVERLDGITRVNRRTRTRVSFPVPAARLTTLADAGTWPTVVTSTGHPARPAS